MILSVYNGITEKEKDHARTVAPTEQGLPRIRDKGYENIAIS